MKIAYSYAEHWDTLTHWQGQAPTQLFALVDVGQLPDAGARLNRMVAAESQRILFVDTFADAARELSPVLMVCDDPLLPGLDELCCRLPILSYLRSALTLDALTQHLQELLNIKTPDSAFLLRYADIQMLPAIIGVLNPTQRAAFLAGIDAWWVVNQRGQLLEMGAAYTKTKPEKLPLVLSDEQLAALLDATIFSSLVSQLRHIDPSFAQRWSPAEQIDFVTRAVAAAKAQGVIDADEIRAWCFACWQQRTNLLLPA